MNINDSQKEALHKLLAYRETIEDIVSEIEAILQVYFPQEFEIAYQHWLPQILTSLRYNKKWLSRGEYSMEYTINRILDQINFDNNHKGVCKYIDKEK